MSPTLALVLKALVIAASGAVATFAGSPLVRTVFRVADAPRGKAKAAAADEAEADSPGIQAAASTLRGGHWIGLLERLAIYAAILSGFGEGIAVVLAVKGLARYPELRATTPGAAERFIIGTFVSVLFAAACAGLASWLTTLW
jgi:F0F1-type ATP synthase membrane subunit c/vacuolar-type H+-ATPase subunit K